MDIGLDLALSFDERSHVGGELLEQLEELQPFHHVLSLIVRILLAFAEFGVDLLVLDLEFPVSPGASGSLVGDAHLGRHHAGLHDRRILPQCGLATRMSCADPSLGRRAPGADTFVDVIRADRNSGSVGSPAGSQASTVKAHTGRTLGHDGISSIFAEYAVAHHRVSGDLSPGVTAGEAVRRPPGYDEAVTRVLQPSDEELMAGHMAGERAAFAKLFARWAGRLRSTFTRAGFLPEEAEDLVQLTFLHLHRSRTDFEIGSSVRRWLYAIAFNASRSAWRRKFRKPEISLEADGDEACALVVEPADVLLRLRLRDAMGALTAAQREVVDLHWFEGLTFPEVARILGTTEGAAKIRAHRASQRLQKRLRAAGIQTSSA